MQNTFSIRKSCDVRETISVLTFLYQQPPDLILDFQRWKYEQNPFNRTAVSFVAEHNGKIIGHVGFTAFPIKIAHYEHTDTCYMRGSLVVHPQHRGHGLATQLLIHGNRQLSNYLKLSTTTLQNSRSLVEKTGSFKICTHRYRDVTTLRNFVHYLINYSRGNADRFHGGAGEFSADTTVRAEDMAYLSNLRPYTRPVIEINRNKKFYKWRFQNPTRKYIHYYNGKSGSSRAFISVVYSWNKLRGYIMDYGYENINDLDQLLIFALKKHHFDILSIPDYISQEGFNLTKTSTAFKSISLVTPFEFLRTRLIPVYSLPSAARNPEWLYQGIDIREKENWSFLGGIRETE